MLGNHGDELRAGTSRVYVPHSLISQPGRAWVESDFGRTTLLISSSQPAADTIPMIKQFFSAVSNVFG